MFFIISLFTVRILILTVVVLQILPVFAAILPFPVLVAVAIACRGVARNLLRGTKKGALGRMGADVPQRGPGGEPPWESGGGGD